VRGKDVFVLQSTACPPMTIYGDHVDGGRAEALFGGAHHRRDPVIRLSAAGPPAALGAVPISAKVVANMLTAVGVDGC
jgi:hypothetical protein